VLNAACFALQHLSGHLLTALGAKVNGLLLAGQWWRLLTPALLHAGLLHLAVNAYSLHSIGPEVERLSGRARFLSVYVLATAAGTAASVLGTPAPSIGASAAIFGLGAAVAVYHWRHRHLLGETSSRVLRSLGWTLALNALYSAANRRVDNWGHLGGMLGGALAAWALGPRLQRPPGAVGAAGRGALLYDTPPLPLLASRDPYVLR